MATFLQMTALLWVMLSLPGTTARHTLILTAGMFTFIAGAVYIRDGIGQLHHSGHGKLDCIL